MVGSILLAALAKAFPEATERLPPRLEWLQMWSMLFRHAMLALTLVRSAAACPGILAPSEITAAMCALVAYFLVCLLWSWMRQKLRGPSEPLRPEDFTHRGQKCGFGASFWRKSWHGVTSGLPSMLMACSIWRLTLSS